MAAAETREAGRASQVFMLDFFLQLMESKRKDEGMKVEIVFQKEQALGGPLKMHWKG